MAGKLIVIMGTNASGKSGLGVELALQYGGEVVSADSRQVFRGLDLGSGKITSEETKGVPHHLIDVCDPGDFFSMADFQRLAYEAIDGILARGKLPFLVGGTGLYVDAVIDGYELSDKGKEYVNSFMKVYTSVVMREEYAPYVSKIVVEGHTDPRGSYSHNMTLSQNRANAVHTQCVDHTPAIASILSAQGCGYDYPVYNDNGSINMDRSRRVTFRFVLQAK